MRIALNNQNVILKRIDIGIADCYQCCFANNWSLCEITELRDYTTICRAVKVFDDTELKEVFKL